uniref:Cleavage stimulation factor n=1 Tax=Antonospora locustae TaxID=278021 RepID=Q6E6D6_ANTLO|nr:cleavage stimulation factor [Antonospora locustae]|eukprot:jgi/Antlo1/736/373
MARGCTVFVGNIDFEVPEEKIVEELSAVGKVVSFRMMYDRATGKSKGYGFAEYESPLIAETAVQTLRISFNGRLVKINYAESDLPQKQKAVDTHEMVDVEEISRVVKSMDRENLKKVLVFLKRMAIDQPTKLKAMFDENKGLVIAVFEALLQLKIIESSALDSIVKSSLKVEENKSALLRRLCQMSDEDLMMYPEDVRSRINKVRGSLQKKGGV